MEILAKRLVPLPAFVDDWVDKQCQTRGIAFRDLALEALLSLRTSIGLHSASGTPLDADLATWFDAEVAAYGTGPEDRVAEALCTLCAEHTGADLVTMDDSGWRRVLPPSPGHAASLPEAQGANGREVDTVRPIQDRSGPLHALSRERSRIVHEAWRAAGRPRHVSRVMGPDGPRYVLHATKFRGAAREFVTEDEWRAWSDWAAKRYRLRRELGWGGVGQPIGVP